MKKIVLFLLLISSAFVHAQTYSPNWESLDARPAPQWFKDAKFGIFIHWGVYSVPAWAPVGKDYAVYSKYSEWYWNRLVTDSSKVGKAFRAYHNSTYGPNFKYQDFAPLFKAELFNPEQWADVFKNAGAQYVVLTSKHHDGFALWPSAEAWNWNAADVGPHKDLAGELTNAVKEKGLHMGFYYSLYEWFNPLYKSDIDKYVSEHMMPQLKDLVNRYKPDIIWPDGEWEHPSETWKSTQFLAWLYNESPVKNTVVVNDRWGKETRSKHGGYYTTEYDIVHNEDASKKQFEHPWEECRGIGGSFGYNRNETLGDYETSDAVIHMLIQKVARGGNLLLDIGPAADGTIPVIMQQRLADMGAWLKTNGEAIFGTTATKQPSINGAWFTQKNMDLYVILTAKMDKPLTFDLATAPGKATLLGVNKKVTVSYRSGKCTINPLELYPNLPAGGYAWVIKLEGAAGK
ncbi:alpha-L-fucosidase [Niastella yeongjuensis]|uniref:alpha-L-fucosidase n=1 Tax=Niastella yeongjuensis TaxID=354355 RepID=A0A1V9E1W8_9BACT|nr:alpha-L-fucosidase [Niastella yeongjuensis]OQP40061.1 alpha-L-fucosidase [Niastella yeongjuensis]SEO15430.1 alpha-L-fucosidase [Niastella yeongjuensis]